MTQLAVMTHLYERGASSPARLAELEGVSRPWMTRLVTTLCRAGLTLHQPHPTNGRTVLISLTPTGQELIAHEVLAGEQWLVKQLADLPAAERLVLRSATRILGAINDNGRKQ